MPSVLNRKYLTRKSPPDQRDYGISSFRAVKPTILPPSIDLTAFGGPVRDQGQMGSCTAFASTAALELIFRKYQGKELILSPLYQYYNERIMDGDFDQGDTGSTGRTAVKCINKFGVCLESDMPYDDGGKGITAVPTPTQVSNAMAYKAGAYHAITNVQDMKGCIASGYPFIVGFTVYDSFEADTTASSGLMPVPDLTKESVLGGHEVCFVGYDDTVTCPRASAGAFKVQNSWGDTWGKGGYFYFSYQSAADPNVFMDAFIQHFGKPW